MTIGPWPRHEVVLMAVRKAVSAATRTFTASSMIRCTILVFYVSGHMFCYFNIDDFSSITIKCDPAEMVELKERYQAIGEPFNGDKRYWVSVQLGQDVPDDEVRALVSKSYHLVAEKYR